LIEDARKLLAFENLRALVTRAWMMVTPLSPQLHSEGSSTPQQ
jgi:hypothetical protein